MEGNQADEGLGRRHCLCPHAARCGEEKWWGTPCPKINGKGFMSPGREQGSFGLMVTRPEKE
uniref:hypothetical protein n=1 Tax=Klebsiella pneumoniae TaxID=573 RepID=UPI001953DC34